MVFPLTVIFLTPFPKTFLIYTLTRITIRQRPLNILTVYNRIYCVSSLLISTIFDVCDVEKCLNKLKIGKACGLDNITKEFVMYSHPAIVVHLKLLFNIMVHHGFVPDSFGNGVIIPLVKDKQGDLCNIDNYRGITLSSFFAKLFEHCILDKYDYLMLSNYLQFGL